MKSRFGRIKKHAASLSGLGLRKINQEVLIAIRTSWLIFLKPSPESDAACFLILPKRLFTSLILTLFTFLFMLYVNIFDTGIPLLFATLWGDRIESRALIVALTRLIGFLDP